MGVGDEGFVIFDAGGVGEEVADEHALADASGQFGEPAADGVVEGKAVVFFQQEDSHGGELFCEGSHSEVAGGVERGLRVGETGGVLIEDIAVFLDGEGDAGLVGGKGMKEGIEPGG